MRIIAGRFRHRILQAPPGRDVRPTADRLRESLFNILGATIAGAAFIDAYAGSGAVGLEALSRGAEPVFWIESERGALAALRANLAGLDLPAANIVGRPVKRGLAELSRLPAVRARGGVDFVFLDPPYAATEEYARTLNWLGSADLLHAESTVIAEHACRNDLAEEFGGLRRTRRLRQGDSALSFYRLRSSAQLLTQRERFGQGLAQLPALLFI